MLHQGSLSCHPCGTLPETSWSNPCHQNVWPSKPMNEVKYVDLKLVNEKMHNDWSPHTTDEARQLKRLIFKTPWFLRASDQIVPQKMLSGSGETKLIWQPSTQTNHVMSAHWPRVLTHAIGWLPFPRYSIAA